MKSNAKYSILKQYIIYRGITAEQVHYIDIGDQSIKYINTTHRQLVRQELYSTQ